MLSAPAQGAKPTPPSEEDVFRAFEQAKAGAPDHYASMDFQTFFFGFLIARGWAGKEAWAFVLANPIGGS